METQVIDNSDLHFEHTSWKKEILFWKDEIKTFQNRLEDIVALWTSKKVMAELEQFQNVIIIHKKRIDELKDVIDAHEHNIAQHLIANENVLDIAYVKKHDQIREKMETERLLYYDLKKSFFQFASKRI